METCKYCDTDLKEEEMLNYQFKRKQQTHIFIFNCYFCYSEGVDNNGKRNSRDME